MLLRLPRTLTIVLTALVLILLSAGVAYAVPADVQDHWAQPAVKELMRRGVLVGYPDRTFKPDRFVSRAEFAKMAVKAFGLPAAEGAALSDMSKHWARKDVSALVESGVIEGYPDRTFRPDRSITRAEIVSILDRLLRVGTKEQVFGTDWTPSYPDVPKSHWGFRLIELARLLDYLPPAFGSTFLPNAVVTRAEAAWMVHKALGLGREQGTAVEVNADLGSITILPTDSGDPVAVQVDPEALVLRNNASVPLNQILPNDKVVALHGSDGLAKVVMTSGNVNTNDLVSRLSGITSGLLTPDAAMAIASGDWTTVKENLKGLLFDRLVQMGLGPGEAQSMLDQDWMTLDLLSRDQLVTALSTRLGLSPDLSMAILSQDLTQIKSMLQTELTAAALGRLLQGQA